MQKHGPAARGFILEERHMSLRIRLGDKSRLILVALALAAIMVACIVWLPTQYLGRTQWKWIRFSMGTIFLIWLSLHAYWKLRKSIVFWCIFCGFLLIHCFGVGRFYYVGEGLSTLDVSILAGAECGCMAVAIYWILHKGPDLRQRPARSRWTPTL